MSIRSHSEIQVNMDVFTADAVRVGRVKEIRDHDMLVDRRHERDVYIPFNFVNRVAAAERRIDLAITDAAFGEHEWERPSII